MRGLKRVNPVKCECLNKEAGACSQIPDILCRGLYLTRQPFSPGDSFNITDKENVLYYPKINYNVATRIVHITIVSLNISY